MTFFSIRDITRIILFTALSTSLPTISHSYDLGPVKIHGFLSQGYILTSDNVIHAFGSNNKGSFELNEIALNGSYQLKDSIVFSGQIGSRDLGNEGNNAFYIDYLQADIQLTDWFGTRLGRYKVPLGFYNQTRDIDLARPMVFLPQSIYPEAYRPFVANATGALIYGNINSDAIGNLDYELFYGRAGDNDDSCLVHSMQVMLHGTDMSMESSDVYGGSLQYTPPLDGLRLGITFASGKADFKFKETTTGFGLNGVYDGSMDSISVLSIEYAISDFLFVSEYMYSRQTNKLKIGSTTLGEGLSEPEGFYIGGSWQVTDQFETALYWENFYGDIDNKHGKDNGATGMVNHHSWHKAWALALRYNITDWWLIKAEGRIIDGTALTSSYYNEPGSTKRHWNSLSFKTTFHF